jgi:hypothetical protein
MPEAGQHVFFSSTQSLLKMAAQLQCSYQYMNGLHILYKPEHVQIKKTSLFTRIGLRITKQLNKILLSEASFTSKTWDDHLLMKSKMSGKGL